MKKILFFLFLFPLVCFADFATVDSHNLSTCTANLSSINTQCTYLYSLIDQRLNELRGQGSTNNQSNLTLINQLADMLVLAGQLKTNSDSIHTLLVSVEGDVDYLRTVGSQVNDNIEQMSYNLQDLLADADSISSLASEIDITLGSISGFVGQIIVDLSQLKTGLNTLTSINTNISDIEQSFNSFTNSFNLYAGEINSDLDLIYQNLLVLSSIDSSTAGAYTNLVNLSHFLTNGFLYVKLGPQSSISANGANYQAIRWSYVTDYDYYRSQGYGYYLNNWSKDSALAVMLNSLYKIANATIQQQKSGILTAVAVHDSLLPQVKAINGSLTWTTNYLDSVDRENWRRQLLYMDDTTRFLELIYNELAVMSYSNSVNNADIVDILTNTNIVDEISHDYSDAASAAVDPSTDKIGEWSFDFASFDQYKESFYKPIHRAGQGIGEVPSEISFYLPGLHPAGEAAVGLGYVYTDLSQHSGFFEFCRGVCRFLYLGITLLFFWFCFKIVMRIYKYLLDKLSGIAPRN